MALLSQQLQRYMLNGVNCNNSGFTAKKSFSRKRSPCCCSAIAIDAPSSLVTDVAGIKWGSSKLQGAREEMEDDVVVRSDGDIGGFSFAAVFDGHAGFSSVEFLREELYKECVATLQDGMLLSSKDSSVVKKALEEAFINADTKLLNWLEETGKQTESGSTATAILLRNDMLIVSHVGDSSVVLSRSGKAEVLTNPHRPYGNNKVSLQEIRRIREAGGWIVNGRICGDISVSRAFGDLRFKTKKNEMLVQGVEEGRWTSKFISRVQFKGDLVTASPDIYQVALASDSEFLLLASDGLWDYMNSLDAVTFVRNQLREHGNVQRACEALAHAALDQRSQDNVSIIIADLGHPFLKWRSNREGQDLAVQNDWDIKQLDVTNAFLHGHLKETVYMTQPQGFVDPEKPIYVCKLLKSLYGLKQAPRVWYEELVKALLSFGFETAKADPSLFVKKAQDSVTFLLVYADDILLTSSSAKYSSSLIQQLSATFAMKDLGSVSYILGMEIKRNANGLFLSQNKYTCDLLEKSKMIGAKPCSTPSSTTIKLDPYSGEPLSNPSQYRFIVGALQYLTWTRPDISISVNQICQYMHAPTYIAVKRVLRYLKGTVGKGVYFTKGSTSITAFSDADWAGCPTDRRSTTGFCIYFGSNLISWCAKKQTTVSRSSTESEYRSLAYTAAEIYWLCILLKDLGIHLRQPPILWCDNISAISLSNNPIFHARTKHIEVDYHYVRELVTQKLLDIKYVCTEDQIADVFTKGLAAPRFQYLISKLSLQQAPFSLREGKDKTEEHNRMPAKL